MIAEGAGRSKLVNDLSNSDAEQRHTYVIGLDCCSTLKMVKMVLHLRPFF